MADLHVSASGIRVSEPSCPCHRDAHCGEQFVEFARGVLESLGLPWLDLNLPVASHTPEAAAQVARPALEAPGSAQEATSYPGKRRRDATEMSLTRPAANETADASMSGCLGFALSESRRFGTLVDAAEERRTFRNSTSALARVDRTAAVNESVTYWLIRDAVEAAVAAGQIG